MSQIDRGNVAPYAPPPGAEKPADAGVTQVGRMDSLGQVSRAAPEDSKASIAKVKSDSLPAGESDAKAVGARQVSSVSTQIDTELYAKFSIEGSKLLLSTLDSYNGGVALSTLRKFIDEQVTPGDGMRVALSDGVKKNLETAYFQATDAHRRAKARSKDAKPLPLGNNEKKALKEAISGAMNEVNPALIRMGKYRSATLQDVFSNPKQLALLMSKCSKQLQTENINFLVAMHRIPGDMPPMERLTAYEAVYRDFIGPQAEIQVNLTSDLYREIRASLAKLRAVPEGAPPNAFAEEMQTLTNKMGDAVTVITDMLSSQDPLKPFLRSLAPIQDRDALSAGPAGDSPG